MNNARAAGIAAYILRGDRVPTPPAPASPPDLSTDAGLLEALSATEWRWLPDNIGASRIERLLRAGSIELRRVRLRCGGYRTQIRRVEVTP